MGISSSNQRKDEEGFYSLTNENNLKRKDSNFKHRARLFKILNRDLTIEEINNLRDKKDLFKFEYKTLGIYEKNFLHYITQNSNERVLRNFCHVFPAIAKYLSCQTENRSYPYQSLFINEYPNVLYEANIYLEYDLKIDILEPHYSKFNHLIEKKSFLDELNIYYNHSDH